MERNAAQTPFARHVKGWTVQELENASEALRGLRDHPGWSVLMDLLAAETRSIDEKLDNAVLLKFEERRKALEASVGAGAEGTSDV